MHRPTLHSSIRFFVVMLFVTGLCAAPARATLQVLGGAGFTAGVSSGGTPTTSNGTDFGTLTLPDSDSNTFRLKNNSNSAVSIIQLAAEGAAFDITSGGVTAGSLVNLPANGSRDFTVRFDPSTAGVKSGSISILTIQESPFVFDLAGEAVGEPEIVVRGRPISAASYVSISDGDTSPRNDDGTAFGTWGADDGVLTRTF